MSSETISGQNDYSSVFLPRDGKFYALPLERYLQYSGKSIFLMKWNYCLVKNQFFNAPEPKEGSFKGEIFSCLWFRIKVKQTG